MQTVDEKQTYLSEFERFDKHGAEDPSWIRSIRRAALSRFAEIGFPTTHHEDWKYTNVAPIVETHFRPVFEYTSDGVSAAAVESLRIGERSWPRLVFVNGLYSKELSALKSLPPGVEVMSLGEALRTRSESVEPHLARHASYDDDGFVALSTAFAQDGAFVHIPQGAVVDTPIELLFVAADDGRLLSHPRNLIIAGRNSRAVVLETYACPRSDRYLTNAVTEVVLGDGAVLDHTKVLVESEKGSHIATTQVVQGRDTTYSSCSVAFAAELARNNLKVLLDAEGASCNLDGLYLVRDGQLVDNHTSIDHARPHGTSRELYKGVLLGRARAVFNGKVLVRKNADKTDAQQVNKNLLLSDRAEVDTKPQLEILANDVKCSHGAAIGQLEPERVFYLRSRGMSEDSARRLLTYGFASDVIRRIRVEPIREALERRVMERLQRETGRR